jgi:hypothetical protein
MDPHPDPFVKGTDPHQNATDPEYWFLIRSDGSAYPDPAFCVSAAIDRDPGLVSILTFVGYFNLIFSIF